MPTIDSVLPKLSNARVFLTVDAKNAFWHCKLDEASTKLTTFQTPICKYIFLCLPYGVSPAPEIFQRKILEALEGLNGVACIVDDILVFGCEDSETVAQQDHDRNLTELLERCRLQGIKLNKDKMKLNQESVTFMGHELTSSGLRPDENKISALQQMPPLPNARDCFVYLEWPHI
jgi:hypothetical protein